MTRDEDAQGRTIATRDQVDEIDVTAREIEATPVRQVDQVATDLVKIDHGPTRGTAT